MPTLIFKENRQWRLPRLLNFIVRKSFQLLVCLACLVVVFDIIHILESRHGDKGVALATLARERLTCLGFEDVGFAVLYKASQWLKLRGDQDRLPSGSSRPMSCKHLKMAGRWLRRLL